MQIDVHDPNLAEKKPRASRIRRVKTGCKTCKIRRVKCDEARPACQCCISTGRVCDGYGIWGGGGNRYEQRGPNSALVRVNKPEMNDGSAIKLRIEKAPSVSPVACASLEEQQHFEFFKDCTSTKLPGLFGTDFWTSAVFQASSREPAVLHAVLALSSAHKRKEAEGIARHRLDALPDKQEVFMLRHYCKAIDYLQPHFLEKGARSVRTALITCLVFTYMEFVRGNFGGGITHLENGLRLVKDITPDIKKTKGSIRVVATSTGMNLETLDGCLVGAFSRLYVQANLAGRRLKEHCYFQQNPSDLPTLKFESSSEARFYLDQVFDGLNHILEEYERYPSLDALPVSQRNMLIVDQQFIQGALDAWERAYNATLEDANSKVQKKEVCALMLLRLYSIMARIMVVTCTSLDQQCVFDQQMNNFLKIVTEAIRIAKYANEPDFHLWLGYGEEWFDPKSCRRVSDIGWVPPLYYTALKCRNHRIRTQAKSLLTARWYRETLWYSKWAGKVAEEVIRIEEGDLFWHMEDDFGKEEIPSSEDLQESEVVPEEMRMQKVEVMFPENEKWSLLLVCKRWDGAEWRTVRRAYNERKEAWVDVLDKDYGQ